MSVGISTISVQFHTTTDDKDYDTSVACVISEFTSGIRGQNIAEGTGTWGGHLPDGRNSNPYNLWFLPTLWNPGQEYVLTVSIDPNGHDTWRFDCYLRIQFADHHQGLHLHGPCPQSDTRSNDYPFLL